MIAAAFLVLLKPYSVQCILLLLLLLLGTIATILFFCCWHRKLRKARHPIKSAGSGRSKSRDAGMRSHFRSEGSRHSPRHGRRSSRLRVSDESKPLVEIPESDQEHLVRRRKIKRSSRVQAEFYHSVQGTPTRRASIGSSSRPCSMSSADYSDEEDDSGQRSGTVSPAPGDTLPWNLPKHERSKRKIHGGAVLDPAERAVLRIADERDKVQKKTFTKWINKHLIKVRKHVNDLYEDLRDGHNLISLLEALSGDTLPRERDILKTLRLVSAAEACACDQHEDDGDGDKGPREKGRMRFHRLQNVQIALDYLKRRQVKLVNIRNDDITDGNPKLTLGLIWTIILHFQISDIHVTGESEDMSAKEKLLLWSQQSTEGYAGVRCENFTSCWRDGRLFNAIIHKYRPDLVDMSQVAVQSNVSNLEKAFGVAEKLGVTRLLDPEDINVPSPDEKSVITYVSSLYDVFPKVPEGGEGINANDVDVKWIEYKNMVNYLIQWIKHHVTVMSDRSYSNNPAELKALYNQYVQFKDTEIPPKEKDKAKIKQLYKLLEVWIEFGRIKLPQGYHPNDVEKEWGKLIIAMLEREKSLRPEVERLEKLQQIASRLQCDSVACEDKLLRARNSLQLDVQRSESGLQFQNEQEVEGYLLESENLIRQQIVDAQILFDGKYYQADQLVQRVTKLRDELMFLKSDYSSVYSKGRSLSMEQTQLMIAGLNQSLNQSFSSGFSQSLTPSLTSSLSRSLTPSLTHGLTPVHTPSLSMALSSGLKPVLTHGFIQGFVPCVDTDKILTVKLMQIRKPLMRSQIIDPTLTEEEINTNFLQDLLNWVEDVQVQLARAEWGSDLPSIDSHLENHKNVHRAIEDFETSIREARAAEGQMTQPFRESYSEKLSELESQYIKLLSTSRDRASHLDNLQDFVTRATNELIWLNEKEEEEVAYDWSDRNSSMLRKKEYHAELMQQLEDKDIVMRSVQDMADQLLLSRHPARPTIEAFKAAMQTQWSWILQLCYCVEKHLKENTAYFEFYNDAKESMDYLKNLQETIKRKYNCDKSSSLVRLEDLVQDSMDEKEQLLQYRSNIVGLMSRAKTIVQLKPRNPENPTRISIPIKAICDYKQIEITIYKDDECVLENNSHRAKWKVISPTGNEAMVPSVCFSVPPPNKEAIEMASRIEQLYQNVLALWHQSHINMKSVVSWHYLINEISTIRAWNVSSIKTMLPGEHQQVLNSLQVHLKDFLEVSQESEVFLVNDGNQLDREVKFCKQYYEDLLKSAEREEQEESACNRFISEVRNIRLRVENCEKRLIRQIRTPMERDDLQESVQKISQQEKLKRELEELITDLEKVTAKCDKFFGQASSSSAPTLRTELNVVLQNLNQVYSLSSIYLDKLKTVNLIVKNSQEAEALVKQYETRLGEEDAVPPDTEAIQSLQNLLKQWRTEVDERRVVFHSLEDELQKGKTVSERMLRAHNERDMDMDWHKEKAVQLAERWENIRSQIDNRLHELESISISLNWYRDCYKDLDQWIQEMEAMQQKMQERQPEDILADELNQQKVLASQVEMKQGRMDECQKYSDEYSSAVKEYELQLMTYKAMVDSQQKSPVKRRRMQSSSDAIVQEFMDLRTRYTALVTLMTQYVKFASDALKRSEEEGKSVEEAKQEHVDKVGELLKWVSEKSKSLAKKQLEPPAERAGVETSLSEKEVLHVELSSKKDQIDEAVHVTQMFLAKHSDKISEEDKQQTEKQLESLQEAYDKLCEETSDDLQQAQSTLAEEAVEKAFEEKQGDCNKRLQEMCDLLLVTESKIIDYNSGMSSTGDGLADLQQHQVEHQALQREIQANATTLANVVSASEEFLEKNGDKLQPDERAAMDKKLKDAKAKLSVLSEQVDSNLKNIDNAVTTALKQETEKAAAVEQLKENENKIQGLLGWLSSIGPETVQQNGNTIFVDGLKRLENEDTVNGNLPRELSETKGNETMELTTDGDLNYQYQKAKLHHQQVMSQQQSYIISTQSVHDFLKKQGSSISAEEREKLEQDLNELKVQYETALAQSESRLKLVHTVQDELQKFSTDYNEFENWLHQSEQQLDDLQSGATDVEIFVGKLQRQKSFSEDVISHKGDLRYITISGQRVLDAAKSCGKLDLGKDAKPCIDTSATCALVERQLEVASDCYKLLHSKCNTLGKNLKDVVDKYSQYQEISASLLPWLQATEEAANSQLAEAIAADPQNLQKQLEQVKDLQDQMSGHQSVVEKLRKTVDALISTDGDLLLNRDEIQDHLDDVVLRYENLSKSTNDRNEKLRMTLTRSLSVQDGLDEMLEWMESVEKSLEDEEDMPLNSAAIQEAFSKNAALEQNIASRQSSISAIKEKANKFIATADMSSASALQAKVDELAKRFTSASGRQKERTTKLEKLRVKVERFEKTYQKIDQFVTKKSLSLPEIDGPGKNVTELSQHMQEINTELLDQSKDLKTLNQLAEELGVCATAKERTQILNKVNTLSKNFQELEEAVKKKEEKLSCCQHQSDQFKALLMVFKKWVEGMNSRIPIIEPSLTTETLQGHLSKVQVMLNEWSSNASLVEEVHQNGSALCHLINTLTSPAHSRTIFKSGTQVANGGGAVSAVCDSKELITIQQDIADVNHQYEELGGLLKNKGSQLESMLAQRQQVQEEAHLVKEWLESMDKRTASWDTLPTETEAIKEQVEQHKAFEAELNQKTGKVGQVKEKLALLLEENTDAPEAGKWRQMLDYIDSKWQQVSQSATERQQKLEESSSFLIQFETAEVQLSQWLVEKELMMNVLGPLSIDPHMLNNQKQQVQILLKEFESRKPQHEQLKTAADGILSRLDDPTPACGVVSDQLAAVMHKWDNLTGKLVDRSDLIDQAIVKSTRYQNIVRDLSGRLSALDIKLASQPLIGSQPEAVKSQLEAASEIRSEVEQEEKSMQEAQTLCEEISSLVGEQYLKAELSRQLDNVLKPFRDLEERAGNRVHQLQSALANSEQFQQMFDDFQAWMGGKRREQDQRAPVSAKLECLHLLIDEQAEFQKSLAQKAGSYEMILVEGEALLQNMQPGAEKTALQGRLGTLRADWEELARQVEARQEKMRDCFQKAQKYRECVEHLLPWIQECEEKASRVQVCSDAAEIESSLASIRGLQTDVDKHRRALESLNNAADSLIEVSQTDVDDIQNEKASVNQKVDLINEQLRLQISSLDEMAKCMKEFQNSLKDAKKQLDGAKQQLELHDALGPQAYSNKCLTNMNAQQKTLQALSPQVENVGRLAQRLAAGTSDGAGTSLILRQAGTLQEDYGSVSQQVRERCCFLETKLQGIGRFQNNIREMFSLFADLDDELDSMAPVGRHLSCLHVQKDGIREFIVRLQELTASIEGAKIEGRQLLESASSPDLLGLKRDLDALSKQCNKLLDRAMVRQEQVETNLARVEEFDSRCKTFSKLVAIAEEHEESQGSVGTETDIINQQLESFKVFQKEEIEPLQTVLQEVNRLGQGLIQSAAKNTNIQKLEHDLEEANTRWNTLTTKVAERAAKLQEALLHCGRFQDAFESLLSWLMDTEELVANQKPPSAEFKVVKAQIQEQKLLQHLLDDRKPTVEMIKREGEKIAGLADSMDREKTLNQLQGLSRRWNSLLAKAENRQRQLEAILVVAQQFHDTVEPLIEWLSAAEKKVANSEPIGTQTTRLQEQISQHKAMEDDIVSHGKQLHQAISVGQLLKNMSSRDDKDMLQGRLDSAQTRYIEIQDRCSRKAALIQQALSNAWIFGEEEVEVLNWLAEVQDRLNNAAIQDYDPEHLQKQHSEHLALHEDIMQRKQHVDQAIKNGLALLKQTTGDEVIIIQERLDGIKARYAEITTTSAKVLKTLEQALQLATKFQSAHEVLATWLEKVEAELTSYASEVLAGEQLAQAQERQKELRNEMMEHRVSLDTVNEISSALLELVPWRAREGLDKLVSDDNERYRLVSDTIAQKVEEIDAAIQRSQQFEQAADAEIAWITETEKKLKSLGDIRLEQDQTSAELQVQKAFSMDILRHKDTIDELVANGDQIMNSCTEEEKTSLQNKLDTLQKQYEVISQMNAERYLQLERAQSLVSQFCETYEELWPWLAETRVLITQLPTPAIEFEMLKQQQEELRQLRELIAEHKPHIDKMNKTGPQLLELSPREGLAIQQKYTAADALYSQVKEDVKRRATSLDEAISQSTQFHDKISPMLDALERIATRLQQPPSISAEVEKIREQISENKNVTMELEKLQPAFETLKQRGDDLIGRSEGTDKDFCAKAVQDQLDKMIFYWADIKARAEEREAKLLDVMDLAEKFWCDHSALIVTIKDTQDLIRELEEPGIDPSVVKEQQEALETIKEEVDGLQEELEIVQNLGAELTSACGEPDKPVVKKNIDELNCTWDNLNKAWKERIDRLDEAMQETVQFQDALQAMFDWMDIAESKLSTMPPIGTDLETVKQQIAELKHFKTEAYQQQIEMERLNHQGVLLLKKVNEDDAKRVAQEPLHELKHLWVNLDGKIVNRQHKLEGALLALGQFQHALDELMTWLTHTEELLNEQKTVGGDPKAIEIAIAKHHVLQNDVLAHKSTVETVNKAGNDLLESSDGEEASSLQSKLESLNQRWKNILEQTEQRQQQLNHTLIQAQGFQSEIENMQRWLVETERQLSASKPVGGLPETAREQLHVHLELCAAFKSKEEIYKNLINRGRLDCEGADDSNVEQGINNLKERWESVEVKLNERKVKLEEALNLATEFHNSLQDFINWLTQAEQTLTLASSPSLILDTIMFQIDEHKVFANEVNSHREKIIELDKTGTHLKYFSQKQDVVLIKNLLISVQARWEKVVQRSVDRGRGLDDARKRAKQFHEAWKKLMEWLEDSEKNLDSDLEIANDPDKVKMQLVNHKEFQKALGAKHSVYDTTVRTGRSLKEKTTLADDHQKLDDMLSELRDKWDTVCGKSVERQNKLEEALLFSGQFTDALQALIDWLYKIEPMLAEDQPVHGDIDLVMNLIDAHKVFQKELGKRTSGVQALKRSARELVEASRDDSSWVKVQMQELSTRWETVCALSVSKQARLEQALNQAEEFHSAVHVLLEWLAEAEQTLRFHGVLPDDDEALRGLIEQHKEFVRKLEEKMIELNFAVGMGEAILSICHPDSITTIKHWITIIRARFEEVTAWAKQHQLRLEAALADVIANQELLENLLGWLHGAETILTQRDQEPLPQEIEEVKTLIAEHQTFVEEMTRKQPDVDKVTKTYKRKAVEPTQITSQIPVIDKGRSRKRFPARALYSPATQTIESKNPRANLLVSKWQQVWLLALDRRRKLNDALDRLEELREFANFDFDVWRKRYMRWMNHKKSRVMDFFRRIDKDQDGKITRQEFIDGILSSKFPTSRLEMSAVADIFDRDGDGYIDYYEFVAALHPNKDAYKPLTDADKIEDEVTRQVAKCKCAKRFQVEQIGENKYRFFLGNQFGDSQQLRLVRILRSTVMVRVGGGWMALDEFLVKNDPCRVHHHGSKMLRSESNSSITSQSPIAKGRTNVELREKFMLPETPGQSMAAFRSRGRRSRPSSRAASPNRSTSSASQSVSVPPATTSTPPKTPQHLIRNYDKPWLTNSKTSSPYKSPESPERRIPSPEVTPIQGSKLRPPGYLSGKSFHSGDDSNLSTPPSRGRSQVPVLESRKVPSRPTSRAGSKTGSRTSSRRGSDASDFDISDIQSVCSDVSETVPDTSRSGSRAGSRPSSAKPSKIPTPSRRSPAASKLSTASKR
ncbi:dystonin isoform X3 [Scyliorhinus canicula]|uniref:dystonin isoform X3 n=1 Tax=Scyliorhinus canicula TaxID=7830 RepID=UPI0018F7567B|nr:dystonin isoform X3 [Scyliorhinus canicula]